MEDERNGRMERDIEELKANMAKLMDMIQALATARENPPPPVVPETTPIVVEARRPGAFWPEFGPQGFGPSNNQEPKVGARPLRRG